MPNRSNYAIQCYTNLNNVFGTVKFNLGSKVVIFTSQLNRYTPYNYHCYVFHQILRLMFDVENNRKAIIQFEYNKNRIHKIVTSSSRKKNNNKRRRNRYNNTSFHVYHWTSSERHGECQLTMKNRMTSPSNVTLWLIARLTDNNIKFEHAYFSGPFN